MGLVGYIGYKEVNDYLHRREHAWVNKDYCKNKPKIADIISRSEVNAALDKNEKVAYCRCWKSATVSSTLSSYLSDLLIKILFFQFPFCDGAHGAHNRATGDNTGPLVFKN